MKPARSLALCPACSSDDGFAMGRAPRVGRVDYFLAAKPLPAAGFFIFGNYLIMITRVCRSGVD
jgi:hypothetical protein